MANGFSGFPKEGMAFLRGLKKNNTREWFQARKDTFDQTVKAPMEHLVEAMNGVLAKFAAPYMTEPKKAIYRIYRDTRFSNDKTPYKTHIAASMWRAGMEKHISAGYYFSVAPDEIEVAAGIYMPGPEQLRAIREYLLNHHAELRRILQDKTLRKLMGGLSGEPMVRVPKGFAADHPAADLIRYKHWVLFDTRTDPAFITTKKLLPEIGKRFEAMTPLVEFLNRPLTATRQKDPLFMDR
ncbi:MAG TPA: DUF2461 domain-containing protein [Bryobacteraceae bacterium]|nr:DUF2461 domain-containing protein [Bryobacteraceae bacterium]